MRVLFENYFQKKLNLKKNSWPLCFYTFKYLMKNTKN